MHIEYEETIRTKVPAFQGRDARNNELVLETLALHGPLIKYDIFKTLKSKGVKHYATISRRVDNLKKRGYLDVAGKRLTTVGKRREESSTYALTWRGFIASLVTETVIGDIPSVIGNSPLLKFDLPHEVPKEMVINVLKELFTPREIRIIARALLVGFLRVLPKNIESIKQENYLAYLVPGFTEAPEIREKFEEKDLTKLLQIPGLPELALDLVKTYEGQLSEVLNSIRVIKRELAKYMVRTEQKSASGRATMTPPPKDAYVCKRCGYVLPKKDAVISGWDSQSSLKHIHCPRCGKIITHSP